MRWSQHSELVVAAATMVDGEVLAVAFMCSSIIHAVTSEERLITRYAAARSSEPRLPVSVSEQGSGALTTAVG